MRRRLEARLDDQLRDARRDIDSVMEGLKARATELRQRRTGAPTTGEAGAIRAEARAALDRVVESVRKVTAPAPGAEPEGHPASHT